MFKIVTLCWLALRKKNNSNIQIKRNYRTRFKISPSISKRLTMKRLGNRQRPWTSSQWLAKREGWRCAVTSSIVYTKLYKIHTTSFARTGISTCYRRQSAAWEFEVRCLQYSTNVTAETWLQLTVSAFSRRDRSQWPWCGLLEKIIISDGAIIHVSLEGHRHNGKIWVLKIHALLKST
jgi:hypothetical protein